jgi:hypothetical protein
MYCTALGYLQIMVLYISESSSVDPDPGFLPNPDPWLIIFFLDPDY